MTEIKFIESKMNKKDSENALALQCFIIRLSFLRLHCPLLRPEHRERCYIYNKKILSLVF